MGFAIDLRLPFRKYRRQEEELARAGNPTITLAFKVNSSEGLPLSAAATFTEMRIIIRRYRIDAAPSRHEISKRQIKN